MKNYKMELDKLILQISNLEKAYNNLSDWINKEIISDLERDGIIQRFEYTIELFWKTLKLILKSQWEDDKIFPKQMVQKFTQIWVIDNPAIFTEFIEIRNILSHVYSWDTVIESFDFIKDNYLHFQDTITKLKQYIKSNSL